MWNHCVTAEFATSAWLALHNAEKFLDRTPVCVEPRWRPQVLCCCLHFSWPQFCCHCSVEISTLRCCYGKYLLSRSCKILSVIQQWYFVIPLRVLKGKESTSTPIKELGLLLQICNQVCNYQKSLCHHKRQRHRASVNSLYRDDINKNCRQFLQSFSTLCFLILPFNAMIIHFCLLKEFPQKFMNNFSSVHSAQCSEWDQNVQKVWYQGINVEIAKIFLKLQITSPFWLFEHFDLSQNAVQC